jgi:uncharacterized protein
MRVFSKGNTVPKIYVDADACPVKEEIYRVAQRHGVHVYVVANARMRVPDADGIELVLVDDDFDAADNWIVEQVQAKDIVITEDIPLAARAIAKEARVVTGKGREFTPESMGDVLASRDLMADLRDHSLITGGPAPFTKRDRSNFLQRLDAMVVAVLR